MSQAMIDKDMRFDSGTLTNMIQDAVDKTINSSEKFLNMSMEEFEEVVFYTSIEWEDLSAISEIVEGTSDLENVLTAVAKHLKNTVGLTDAKIKKVINNSKKSFNKSSFTERLGKMPVSKAKQYQQEYFCNVIKQNILDFTQKDDEYLKYVRFVNKKIIEQSDNSSDTESVITSSLRNKYIRTAIATNVLAYHPTVSIVDNNKCSSTKSADKKYIAMVNDAVQDIAKTEEQKIICQSIIENGIKKTQFASDGQYREMAEAMILKLIPEEQHGAFHSLINPDKGFDRKCYDNNSIYKSVVDEQIRNIRISYDMEHSTTAIGLNMTRSDYRATLFSREFTLFALSFALNLSYDEIHRYMAHDLLLADFNFRDPFEMILLYCLFANGPKYLNYLSLVEEYLNEYSLLKRKGCLEVNHHSTTNSFKEKLESFLQRMNQFGEEDCSDSLKSEFIAYLCTLPRERQHSPAEVAMELIEFRYSDFNTFLSSNDLFEADIPLFDNKDIFNAHNSSVFNTIQKQGALPNLLQGASWEKIQFDDLMEIDLSKETIISLAFEVFVACGFRDNAISHYCAENCKEISLIKYMYTEFIKFVNPNLGSANFADFCVNNVFERFIMYALLHKDPITFFTNVMRHNKLEEEE